MRATALLLLLLAPVTSLSAGCVFPDPDLDKPITRLPPRTRFPSPPPVPSPTPTPPSPPPRRPCPPLPPVTTGPPPMYRLTPIPDGLVPGGEFNLSQRGGLGPRGEVVGSIAAPGRRTLDSPTRPVVWRHRRTERLRLVKQVAHPQLLPAPWPRQSAVATDGTSVVGRVETAPRALHMASCSYVAIWRNGNVQKTFGPVLGRSGVVPVAMNRHGEFTGASIASAYWDQEGEDAVLWSGGGWSRLGPGTPHDMNDRRDVVGTTEGGRAILWTGGRSVDLGSGEGFGVNNRGEVVGESGPAAPAFLHDGERRHKLPVPGLEHTVAKDINDRSQAVGYGQRAGGEFEQRQAVLWQGRRGYDLRTRVVNGRGWVLREALSINERGQILCEAERGGRQRFCLLTPAR